jgi:hypothetical protein
LQLEEAAAAATSPSTTSVRDNVEFVLLFAPVPIACSSAGYSGDSGS